jgi:hypothetical protein
MPFFLNSIVNRSAAQPLDGGSPRFSFKPPRL